MWRTVLKLEWRIVRRDKAALAVLGIFAAFLVLAALAGGQHAETLSEGLERTQGAERARLEGHRADLGARVASNAPKTARDPRDPVWMGKEGASRVAVLPPSPLAPIAVGQRQLHPQAVRVSTEMDLAAERETETAMSGPTRLMTGAFDPAFLFVVLFPLVIIALSYEILSGERERGTLAMLLSQPVSQHALVLGKAAARALLLCGVTFLFALLGLALAGADLGADGAFVHIALYAAVLIAWALFWFAAAVAVNAWGQTSASNALSLVGLWLLLVVVVPGLMHVVVDAIYPPPSKVELLHEAREAGQEVERKLAGIQGRHDVDTTTTGYAKRVVEVQQELARRSEPVLKELREQVARRQSMVDSLRFVSPAIVTQLALEDVAGAGAPRHQRFEAQVDAYHARYQAHFFEHIRAGKAFSAKDLESVPVWEFAEEDMSALAARILGGVLGLLLFALTLVALAWRGLRRVGRLAR
jgi:ABC-2 type transport system permease protein